MAFINEYIPEGDVVKYGIAAIDIYYFKATFMPDWTVDRARNMYLRHVASGREEFSQDRTFTFYWQEALIEVKLHVERESSPDGTPTANYKLTSIQIPEAMAQQRAQILVDLKDALTTYGGGGVYASAGTYNVTFTF